MKLIKAPISQKEIDLFNEMQNNEKFHSDTYVIGGCGRRIEENNFGKYKQDWFYSDEDNI